MARDKYQPKHSSLKVKDTNVYAILELVVVPLALLAITFLFSVFQADQQNIIENSRQTAQSTVEAGRAQDNLLQTYFDDMTPILAAPQFPEDRPLCPSEDNRPEAATQLVVTARVRTDMVIERLDADRLASLIRFLSEMRLLGAILKCDLTGANLQGANLSVSKLEGLGLGMANLQDANLSNSDLQNAFLDYSNLQGALFLNADLEGAALSDTNLRDANLFCANLKDALLHDADLTGANLTNANLQSAVFKGAVFDASTILPDGTHWMADVDLAKFDTLAPQCNL